MTQQPVGAAPMKVCKHTQCSLRVGISEPTFGHKGSQVCSATASIDTNVTRAALACLHTTIHHTGNTAAAAAALCCVCCCCFAFLLLLLALSLLLALPRGHYLQLYVFSRADCAPTHMCNVTSLMRPAVGSGCWDTETLQRYRDGETQWCRGGGRRRCNWGEWVGDCGWNR